MRGEVSMLGGTETLYRKPRDTREITCKGQSDRALIYRLQAIRRTLKL